MFIQNNRLLLNSYGKVTINKTAKNDTTEKLSSGKRINKAADDAAGLSISESFKSKVRGLDAAERNIQDGISLIQVADGAMEEITKTLHRMKEVSVQASNGTLTDEDRSALEEEFSQLNKSINSIANETEFNGIKLLNEDKSLAIKIKDNPEVFYDLTLFDSSTSALGLDTASLSSISSSSDTLSKVNEALNKVIVNRTALGVHSNNLQSAFNDANNAKLGLTTSLSQIEDINMASAVMKSVKDNILVNSNQSMLVSARQNNESVNSVLNRWLS
ncbi:flagellin [Clostridium sp. HMP27]|uniref:flagellin n=1 Tax=Clostridium sp. HMP27 TaxID=1487921 RepID=UPI00052BA9EF|nr:flagellin [Clostridium sp. HMP27]KGK86077.1 flagellin [Clostridium sp. HMP27]